MALQAPAEVVLIGGGHAHVQVLQRWITDPPPRARLTVVLDRARAVYSGMVPGFVAGDYALHTIEIDAARLARRAGAHVVLEPATAIDPVARRIALAGGAAVPYDVASLDVGATVRDLDRPGVREYALATRPIRDWVDGLDARVAAMPRGRGARVVVVGAGAAGIELGFTLRARLVIHGVTPHVTVIGGDTEILPGHGARVARRVRHEAARRNITLRTKARVVAVERDAVILEHDRVAADLVVWATGAAPLPWLSALPLPRDARGFVRVRPTLQVVCHDDLFAAGDCASIDGAPWVRKAGVYAVREGRVVDDNLRAWLGGVPAVPYHPQRHVLALLHLGDRRALASKWGFVASGRWVWRQKRVLDERFVCRHQGRRRACVPVHPG